MKNLILLLSLLFSVPAFAGGFEPEQLTFDFMSSDGSYWYDCKHVKEAQPHSWTAYCGPYEFHMHIMLIENQRDNEASFEFHFWADETAQLFETHTSSTWLTVDKNSRPKSIIGYLGFLKDAAQLRIGVSLQ